MKHKQNDEFSVAMASRLQRHKDLENADLEQLKVLEDIQELLEMQLDMLTGIYEQLKNPDTPKASDSVKVEQHSTFFQKLKQLFK